MIDATKSRSAILAVQAIVGSARFMANDRMPYEKISELLDVADYLTGLIWRVDDCTSLFEETLRDSPELFGMKSALTLFLDESRRETG
jgi:hypothetical protein